MVRKVITLLLAAAILSAAGGMIYADACGAFDRDNEAAEALINKYMTSVMRSYSGDDDVSFRGIVKEGCDFWYYNDYSNRRICENSRSSGTAELSDYSVKIDSISYSDRQYTVCAEVTERVKYENSDPVETTKQHTFTIEQKGRLMYITNDTELPE